MGKAYRCDYCGKYFDNEAPYSITITNRYMDTRDGEPKTEGLLCSTCGSSLEKKLHIENIKEE